MRLWTVTKAKELCSDWNMKTFFQVVHNDMERCLEHLNDLRLPGEYKQRTHFKAMDSNGEDREAFSTDALEHVFTHINLYQKIENHLFFVLSYFSHLFRPLATAP